MRLKRFENYAEKRVRRIAERAVSNRDDYRPEEYRINTKTHLSEVVEIDHADYEDAERGDWLVREEIDFVKSPFSHFDNTIHKEGAPSVLWSIEFDGETHLDPTQISRDIIKNRICAKVNLPLIRISDDYLSAYERVPLIEWLIKRWIAYEKKMPDLLAQEKKWISELRAEQRNLVTFEETAEHFFNLSNPYPPLATIAVRLWENYGIADSLTLERCGYQGADVDLASRRLVMIDGGPMIDLDIYNNGFSQRSYCNVSVISGPHNDKAKTLFQACGDYVGQSYYPIKHGQRGPFDVSHPETGKVMCAPAGAPWAGAPGRVGADLATYHALRQVEGWAQKH